MVTATPFLSASTLPFLIIFPSDPIRVQLPEKVNVAEAKTIEVNNKNKTSKAANFFIIVLNRKILSQRSLSFHSLFPYRRKIMCIIDMFPCKFVEMAEFGDYRLESCSDICLVIRTYRLDDRNIVECGNAFCDILLRLDERTYYLEFSVKKIR